MGREQNRKEGGGGGEGGKCLHSLILKTSVRQRTEFLIGWNGQLLFNWHVPIIGLICHSVGCGIPVFVTYLP